jgi:hypothetical protein
MGKSRPERTDVSNDIGSHPNRKIDRIVIEKTGPCPGLPDGTYVCIPKIPIWAYFGGPWNGKCCYIFGQWE